MKKIITFSAALILGVCAFGATRNVRAANADPEPPANASTVAGLLSGAKDANGQYTKKTKIFLVTEAVSEIETHFHTGVVPALERTTYYDDTAGALLMGDYDGGFERINSGYINTAANVCTHYIYDGSAAPSKDDLFSNRKDGWTHAQMVGVYYQNLTSLATLAGGVAWETFESNGYNVYKYTVSANPVNSDPVLNAFQYFAAPMLLTDNYITYDSVWVTQATSFLSIRLYASSGDSGKSTMPAGESDVLMAEARVYSGLSLEEVTPLYIKGSFTASGWSNLPFEYSPDSYNPEQYIYTGTLDFTNEFGFMKGETWKGYSSSIVENTAFFGQTGDNYKSLVSGTVDFYYKPSGNDGNGSVYIGNHGSDTLLSYWYICGKGSFLDGGAEWGNGGVQMNAKLSSNEVYVTLTFAVADEFKVVNKTNSGSPAWYGTNKCKDGCAFSPDTSGDYNIYANAEGTYDIYANVSNTSDKNMIWIGTHS